MRPIPYPLRKTISENPFMNLCIYPGCPIQPEWEHALIYAGKQINESWAIVPVCIWHHRGGGLNKNFNRWVALSRATASDFLKYPKKNWLQEKAHLDSLFSEEYDINRILRFDEISIKK